MELDGTKTPKARRGPPAVGKAARRERILARLREGWAIGEIAHEENLSAERVRQIVKEILKGRQVEEGSTHALLQAARLAPAIHVAAEAVAEGRVEAIRPLIRALDRLDRAQRVARAHRVEDDGIREKLIAKLNRAAAALEADQTPPEAGAEEASAGQAATSWGGDAGNRAKAAATP